MQNVDEVYKVVQETLQIAQRLAQQLEGDGGIQGAIDDAIKKMEQFLKDIETNTKIALQEIKNETQKSLLEIADAVLKLDTLIGDKVREEMKKLKPQIDKIVKDKIDEMIANGEIGGGDGGSGSQDPKLTPRTNQELIALIKDKTIPLSKINTGRVKNFNRAFYQSDRTDAEMSGIDTWDTSSMESAFQMFAEMPNITKLDFILWDFRKLQNAREMIARCPKLRSVDMSYVNAPSIETSEDMFEEVSLDTLKFNVASIETWNNLKPALMSAKRIGVLDVLKIKISIPDFKGIAGVVSIKSNQQFSSIEKYSGCVNLESIELTGEGELEDYGAFKNLKHLKTPNFPNLTEIYSGVFDLPKLETLVLGDMPNLTKVADNAFNLPLFVGDLIFPDKSIEIGSSFYIPKANKISFRQDAEAIDISTTGAEAKITEIKAPNAKTIKVKGHSLEFVFKDLNHTAQVEGASSCKVRMEYLLGGHLDCSEALKFPSGDKEISAPFITSLKTVEGLKLAENLKSIKKLSSITSTTYTIFKGLSVDSVDVSIQNNGLYFDYIGEMDLKKFWQNPYLDGHNDTRVRPNNPLCIKKLDKVFPYEGYDRINYFYFVDTPCKIASEVVYHSAKSLREGNSNALKGWVVIENPPDETLSIPYMFRIFATDHSLAETITIELLGCQNVRDIKEIKSSIADGLYTNLKKKLIIKGLSSLVKIQPKAFSETFRYGEKSFELEGADPSKVISTRAFEGIECSLIPSGYDRTGCVGAYLFEESTKKKKSLKPLTLPEDISAFSLEQGGESQALEMPQGYSIAFEGESSAKLDPTSNCGDCKDCKNLQKPLKQKREEQ